MDNVAFDTITPSFYGLITKERAEKLDLLGQLILNQRDIIILCGAEGVGKTKLLNTFKKQRENVWPICLLQGLETLNFEQIQIQLFSAIQQYNPELLNHELQSALSFCEQQQQKAVLMIDDAVNLTTGLISSLTEYALHNPGLRVVFAFTREQLYSKNATDSVLDDCYFMEIPPLTKQQLAVFLQDFSVFTNVASEKPEINDKLIAKLYQCSAGIPGKVVAQLPLLLNRKQKKTFTPSLKKLVAGGILLTSVISFFLIYKASYKDDLPNSLPLKPAKLPAKQNAPAIVIPRNKPVISANVKSLTASVKTTEPETNKHLIQHDADEQWVLQQVPERYTLQLIALSSRQALVNIVKKYHNLESELKILRVKNRSQEKYILLYGSFADNKDAYTAVRSLPAEFRQAWPRKIQALQQEIKNRDISLNQSSSK